MSPRAYNDPRTSRAVAIAIPTGVGFEDCLMRDTIAAVRDTLIVFGLQLVFRATMLLRHMNY